MGMYTNLRFSAPLSGDGMVIVEALLMARRQDGCAWEAVAGLLSNTEAYLALSRRDFIPFGFADGGGRTADWDNRCDVQDGVWYVVCGLKNYNDNIAVFLRDILPQLLSHSCVAETWYEQSGEPIEHTVHPQEADRDGS